MVFTVIQIETSEKERGRRTLSTLRPGCIYYTLIVVEEVLWRAVLSLERVEGLGDIKSIFVYQALSGKTRRRLLLRSEERFRGGGG